MWVQLNRIVFFPFEIFNFKSTKQWVSEYCLALINCNIRWLGLRLGKVKYLTSPVFKPWLCGMLPYAKLIRQYDKSQSELKTIVNRDTGPVFSLNIEFWSSEPMWHGYQNHSGFCIFWTFSCHLTNGQLWALGISLWVGAVQLYSVVPI